MKIGIIGKFGPEEMGKHISDTLINMKYEVFEIEYGPFLNQKLNNNKLKIINKIKNKYFESLINFNEFYREKALKKIFLKIEKNKDTDVIIVTHDYLINSDIKRIRRISNNKNLKIILWFPDGVINVGKAYFLTAGYDSMFFKCKHIVKHLQNYYDLPAYYLTEAFNPKVHTPIQSNEEIYKCDIAIVGNIHSHRLPILEKLVQLNKYKIKIYGTKAPFYLPISKELKKCFTGIFATNEEKSKIFTNAKINLNTLHLGEVEGVNVRVFEIAGAQGFQLMSYRKEVEELFEIGKDLDTFSYFNELVEKIDYYLENEDLRKEMSKNSYEKSKEKYTYEKQLRTILTRIIF